MQLSVAGLITATCNAMARLAAKFYITHYHARTCAWPVARRIFDKRTKGWIKFHMHISSCARQLILEQSVMKIKIWWSLCPVGVAASRAARRGAAAGVRSEGNVERSHAARQGSSACYTTSGNRGVGAAREAMTVSCKPTRVPPRT